MANIYWGLTWALWTQKRGQERRHRGRRDSEWEGFACSDWLWRWWKKTRNQGMWEHPSVYSWQENRELSHSATRNWIPEPTGQETAFPWASRKERTSQHLGFIAFEFVILYLFLRQYQLSWSFSWLPEEWGWICFLLIKPKHDAYHIPGIQ